MGASSVPTEVLMEQVKKIIKSGPVGSSTVQFWEETLIFNCCNAVKEDNSPANVEKEFRNFLSNIKKINTK